MINNLKTLLIIVLIIIAIVLNWQLGYKQKEVDKLSADNGVLADNLKSQVIIEKERIVYKTRVNDPRDKVPRVNGSRISETGKVKTEIKYLPPEGNAEINTDLNGNTTISIRNKGLCFEPCVSAVTTVEGVKAGLGARLAYWGRYGFGVGVNYLLDDNGSNNIFKPQVVIDKRISDVVPFIRNTTVGIVYDGNIGASISIYF
jgi:hypothetical protein